MGWQHVRPERKGAGYPIKFVENQEEEDLRRESGLRGPARRIGTREEETAIRTKTTGGEWSARRRGW